MSHHQLQKASIIKHQENRFFVLLGYVFFGLLFFLFFSYIFGKVTASSLLLKDFIKNEYRATDLSWTPYPYIMFKGKKNEGINNEGGYKGPYPVTPKPIDEYRIFVLGGSTVYFGDPTIPELLTQEFQNNGYTNVRVYNFSYTSAVSSQELMTIVTEISELEPDLIVQYDGANDIDHPLYYDPRPGYPFNYFVYETNPLINPEKLPTWKYIVGTNAIVKFIYQTYFPHAYQNFLLPKENLRSEVGYNTDPWKQQVANIYIQNVMKAQKIASVFDSEYIAFFQPTIFNKRMLTRDELKIIPQEEIDYFIEVQDLIKNGMSSDTTQNIQFVDLTDIFDSYETTVFEDKIHVYQEYNTVIANRMFEVIVHAFVLHE
ncbi:MAG: hypothetical protein WAV51_02115 [Microgenomates group bacterium]